MGVETQERPTPQKKAGRVPRLEAEVWSRAPDRYGYEPSSSASSGAR
jgi:hypothetical protein